MSKKNISILLILLVLSISQIISAEGLILNSWNVDVNVENNGDLKIVEKFQGVFSKENPIIKNISSATEESIDIVEDITIVSIVDSKETPILEDENSQAGSDTFKVISNEKGIALEIYPSNKSEMEIVISYTLKNQGLIHKNIAELVMNLKNINYDIKEFSGSLHLLKESKENLHVFNHSASAIEAKVVESSFEFSTKDLKADEEVNLTFLFPKENILYNNNLGNEMLNDVLDRENASANTAEVKEASKENEKASSSNNNTIAIIFVLIVAVLTGLGLLKSKKK